MGKKSKTSRKGKKAWRANISTEDIHDFFEKSTKDALSGGSLTSAPTESLFFIDKSQDLSVKKKIEKKREKVLRVDSMLKKNPFVEAVPSSKQKSQHSGKARQVSKQSIIPAVEVEPPGCSYNPTFDSHQDSLAQAVAEEMQKAYKIELGPQPVPLTVMGEVVDEDDKYFIEADDGNDDEMDEENLSEDDKATEKRPLKTKRVTRVELNKRARRKEQQKKEAEAKKAEEFSKDIDNLPDILQEIAKEDEEKQKRNLRKAIAKQERLKACPPRLGKYKFQAAPPQVLLSEELTGSLRKLKGCATLARDRFKSLEKRGLIPPSAKSGRTSLISSLRAWTISNNMIKNPICKAIAPSILDRDSAFDIWKNLEDRFSGLSLIFSKLSQDQFTITVYYTKLKILCIELGDYLIHKSVSLLHIKDPLVKRIAASRFAWFAIDGILKHYVMPGRFGYNVYPGHLCRCRNWDIQSRVAEEILRFGIRNFVLIISYNQLNCIYILPLWIDSFSWHPNSSFFNLFSTMADFLISDQLTYVRNRCFLHPPDYPPLSLVSQPLSTDNYSAWKRSMLMVLSAKKMVSFINGSFPKRGSSSTQLLLAWDRLNNMVISWIRHSVCKGIAATISDHGSASDVWTDIEHRFSVPPLIFHKNLSELSRGDYLMHKSVLLLHIKDPLFKRIAASRLARSKKVENSEDWWSSRAVEYVDGALKALHNAGAIPVIMSIPDTSVDAEIGTYKTELLKRFRDSGYDVSS
ncbi:hypothetical protein CXB51_024996 [Gossypium anomalum]|uniref:Ribosome biogenesis protein NOP53 n=1 Tax=Gossypium anomalum TaxID=47600 RepID=A0A8J6CPK1_9ROSI|nr:hypothetical protein CXB51_024996 [Gossypium anomalum]